MGERGLGYRLRNKYNRGRPLFNGRANRVPKRVFLAPLRIDHNPMPGETEGWFGIMMEKTTIGERIAYGAATEPFGLGEERLQHVHIIGQSGAGKSTLMANMVLADIHEGRGVALIDPHGELASLVLERIPPWRTHHVLYVNPQDEPIPCR